MNVSLSWLSRYVDLPGSPAELCELLTFAGVEVEGVRTRGAAFDQVVVARILASDPHPNADRLKVCQVDDGSGAPRQIVCGAKNYRVGDRVPLALPGAVLPGDFRIRVGKLRGVESHGMLCSAKELGLSEDAEGLLILGGDPAPGTPIVQIFPPDTVFELEITPNRPDLLSHVGIARELAAVSGATFRPPPIAAPPGDGEPSAVGVTVEDSERCPHYTARRIRGVRVGPSPDWLSRWLEAVGLRPINNLVDITNFVMFELGQPLHVFDAAKLEGGIEVRRARAGESLRALDGRDYTLRGHDLVIADGRGPVALAGVMGGEPTGVTDSTVEVVLESARFLPAAVRRTSRELGLMSESSYRFERGVNPAEVRAASDRATALILELAGGEVVGGLAEAGSGRGVPVRVSFRYDRCAALMGTRVEPAEADRVLSALGLRRVGSLAGRSEWEVPSHRADLVREVDLIEEIARMRRMDRLPPGRTRWTALVSDSDRTYDFRIGLARRLAALGFAEARTMSLVSPAVLALDPSGAIGAPVLRNPLSEDYSRLRSSLVPGLLRVASANARQGVTRIRMFEIGRVFGEGGVERTRLAIVMSGPVSIPWWGEARPAEVSYRDIKGVVELLLGPRNDGEEPVFERVDDAGMALAVRVTVGDRAVGRIVQVLPSVARELDVPGALLAAELELDGLDGVGGVALRFRPIDRFPGVVRDMALVVPRELPHQRVIAAVRSVREPLLAGVELFDVFEDPTGQKVPVGYKSVAYSLTYRSPERTLTADEVQAAHSRVKAAVGEATGASFRE